MQWHLRRGVAGTSRPGRLCMPVQRNLRTLEIEQGAPADACLPIVAPVATRALARLLARSCSCVLAVKASHAQLPQYELEQYYTYLTGTSSYALHRRARTCKSACHRGSHRRGHVRGYYIVRRQPRLADHIMRTQKHLARLVRAALDARSRHLPFTSLDAPPRHETSQMYTIAVRRRSSSASASVRSRRHTCKPVAT